MVLNVVFAVRQPKPTRNILRLPSRERDLPGILDAHIELNTLTFYYSQKRIDVTRACAPVDDSPGRIGSRRDFSNDSCISSLST